MVGKPVKTSTVWNYFCNERTRKYTSCKSKKDISLGSEVHSSRSYKGCKIPYRNDAGISAGAANICVNARARTTPARVCSAVPRSEVLGWSLILFQS